LLPLCTTFPASSLAQAAAQASVADWLRGKNDKIDDTGVWLGHFGAFHAQGWDFSTFAERIAAQPSLAEKRACFLALGRASAVAAVFAEAAKKIPGAEFHVLGELSEEKVSVAMRACDAAFTSTPWDIIEKSSAVAAWRALDIPVLVTRVGATDAERLPPWPDPGVFLAEAGASFNAPASFTPIPGPPFLNPAIATRAFLSAFISASASRP